MLASSLGLTSDDPTRGSVVQRIEIGGQTIVLHISRERALAVWRARDTGLSDRDVIESQRHALRDGETCVDAGTHLVLSLPVCARFRGGRATMMSVTEEAQMVGQPDTSLVKALARAHRWRAMLINTEVDSIDALAKRLGQDRGHISAVLKLAFLSPRVTRAILRGEHKHSFGLSQWLATDIALSWQNQEAAVASSNGEEPRAAYSNNSR